MVRIYDCKSSIASLQRSKKQPQVKNKILAVTRSQKKFSFFTRGGEEWNTQSSENRPSTFQEERTTTPFSEDWEWEERGVTTPTVTHTMGEECTLLPLSHDVAARKCTQGRKNKVIIGHEFPRGIQQMRTHWKPHWKAWSVSCYNPPRSRHDF